MEIAGNVSHPKLSVWFSTCFRSPRSPFATHNSPIGTSEQWKWPLGFHQHVCTSFVLGPKKTTMVGRVRAGFFFIPIEGPKLRYSWAGRGLYDLLRNLIWAFSTPFLMKKGVPRGFTQKFWQYDSCRSIQVFSTRDVWKTGKTHARKDQPQFSQTGAH